VLSIFVVYPFLNVHITLPNESVSPSPNGVALLGSSGWSLMRVELALFKSVNIGLSPVNSMTAWLRETVLASGMPARLISGPPLSLSWLERPMAMVLPVRLNCLLSLKLRYPHVLSAGVGWAEALLMRTVRSSVLTGVGSTCTGEPHFAQKVALGLSFAPHEAQVCCCCANE